MSRVFPQERQWNQIQETAAKKTLELGQITYATLNLFEMAGGVIGVSGLHIHDTEKQLEAVGHPEGSSVRQPE